MRAHMAVSFKLSRYHFTPGAALILCKVTTAVVLRMQGRLSLKFVLVEFMHHRNAHFHVQRTFLLYTEFREKFLYVPQCLCSSKNVSPNCRIKPRIMSANLSPVHTLPPLLILCAPQILLRMRRGQRRIPDVSLLALGLGGKDHVT